MQFLGSTSQQIFDCIRSLVINAELLPGDALPPVRELADILEVNRNTVSSAYKRLAKAGIAVTQGRLGTTICAPPSAGEQEGLSIDSRLIDLADGNPNPKFLADPLVLFSASALKRFLYGEATILPELHAIGASWFAPDCPESYTLELTHGAVDAIERLVAAHLVVGDKVAVEDPCFLGTQNVLRLAAIETVGIAMDDQGMLPQALSAALSQGVRAVIITPRAQNPSGCSLSANRAQALQKIISGHPNVLIIVDDHFALLAEADYYSVISQSTTHWALIRSTSKGLGPDLRVAMLASDPVTATRLRARLAPGMSWISHILQTIVAIALASKEVADQLCEAQAAYQKQRAHLCCALRAQSIAVNQNADGLNIWIAIVVDEMALCHALAKRGWLVRPGKAFQVKTKDPAIRVTVSKLQEAQAQKFASDLSICMRQLTRRALA